MIRLLRKAWAAANDAVAFSMLSKTADRIEEGRHYYDPIQMTTEALRLTRYTVLRQDYMPHDLTLYLYRNRHGECTFGEVRSSGLRRMTDSNRLSGPRRGLHSSPTSASPQKATGTELPPG